MLSAKEVQRMKMVDIVDESQWQKLRKSLVGTWKSSPIESTQKLKDYVGDGIDPIKVRRVLNYLTGTYFRLYSDSLLPETKRLRTFVSERWRDLLERVKYENVVG